MPLEKPKKPTELIPRAFGGIKNNFSDDLQLTGFEPNIPQTYNGDNLNYHLDATGKELDYVEKVVDFINQAPVNHIPFVNENNQLDYVDASSLGSGAFDMFDTKISDHILEGEQAKGWALQGTYVSKEVYPDFYSVCLAQKEASEQTEVTLGESTLTMFVNSNGHQFYNIADKSIVDTFYNTYGIADFYGIDEENERIFLPRNKYFAVTGEVPVVGNGYALGLTNGDKTGYLSGWIDSANNGTRYANSNVLQTNYPADSFGSSGVFGITTDPRKSGIEAKLTPNENKYLYYCVGNTEVTQAITNVTEVTTSENDTIPLFTGMYFDFKPNNVSWLKAGEQQNNAGIYKTCYDTLVEIVNGVNNYDLKVINKADMLSGVIYDEYWILDQDNLTFRTPIRTSERVLIETKVAIEDDPTWYNLYSDGWCEQGGSTYGQSLSTANTINLSKPFKDINYTVDVSFNAPSSNTGGYSVGYDAKTVNSFIVRGSSSGTNKANTFDWQASGYVSTTSNVNSNLYFKVANAVQNLELLNAGEVLEAVNNIIPKNRNVWDGQWVSSNITLSTSTSSGTQIIDLSDYLPNDDYNYEVLLYCYSSKKNNTTAGETSISSDIITSSVVISVVSIDSFYSVDTLSFPIGTQRTLNVNKTNDLAGFKLIAHGYRRLGINQ